MVQRGSQGNTSHFTATLVTAKKHWYSVQFIQCNNKLFFDRLIETFGRVLMLNKTVYFERIHEHVHNYVKAINPWTPQHI